MPTINLHVHEFFRINLIKSISTYYIIPILNNIAINLTMWKLMILPLFKIVEFSKCGDISIHLLEKVSLKFTLVHLKDR